MQRKAGPFCCGICLGDPDKDVCLFTLFDFVAVHRKKYHENSRRYCMRFVPYNYDAYVNSFFRGIQYGYIHPRAFYKQDTIIL